MGHVGDLVAWDASRLGDVAALWSLSSDEPMPRRDLERTLGEGQGVVLASPDGSGLVAAVTRADAVGVVGHVRLLVVARGERRRGHGRRLLAAAEDWMRGQGADRARLGGEIPRYLWPGVDARDLGMQALALTAGYRPGGCAVNLVMPTAFRFAAPAGIRVRRVADADAHAAASLRALVDREWPAWRVEVDLALRDGTAVVATPAEATSDVRSFCAHSTLRAGWIGPMGTAPTDRGHGLASAVLSGVCADLAAAGCPDAEVAWVGPLGMFADLGAVTSRVFRVFTKEL